MAPAPPTPTFGRQLLATWIAKLGTGTRSMPAWISPWAAGLLLLLLVAVLLLAKHSCTLRKTNATLRARLEDFDGFETCFQKGFRALYEHANEHELRATLRLLKLSEPITPWVPHEVLLDIHKRTVREFLRN